MAIQLMMMVAPLAVSLNSVVTILSMLTLVKSVTTEMEMMTTFAITYVC